MTPLKNATYQLGSYAMMLGQVGRDVARGGVNLKDLVRQIVAIGVTSIPITMITAIFTGMVLALQTAYGLERFGAKDYVGNVVSLSLIRELGPVLTAIMLCGRVGAGIAAGIGSMVVTEQVDAIRTLGADPIRKLVTPRVIAAILVLPLLTIFADAIGIYGGALVAVYELDTGAYRYYRAILYTVLIKDVFDGLIKSCIFGFLLVSISCYKGLSCRGGTAGVGQATTSAVVISSIVVFVADYFLTKLLMIMP